VERPRELGAKWTNHSFGGSWARLLPTLPVSLRGALGSEGGRASCSAAAAAAAAVRIDDSQVR
jgi:hypothetical protein